MKIRALIATVLLCFGAGAAEAGSVGFSEVRIEDGAAGPLVTGIWYPTNVAGDLHRLGAFEQTVAPDAPVMGSGLPLVVISHGNGGRFESHYDTALALAEAGFVVAAVSHTGDTYSDQSRALVVTDRPAHIHRVIDYMLAEWPDHAHLAPGRIGMFGFSSGGFTALVSIGGVPDLSLTVAHAKAHPDYYDAKLMSRVSDSAREAAREMRAKLSPSSWVHDARIKTAVVAAPALGYTFGREGLKNVSVPVQLWRAAEDQILPHPDYAEAVRLALPQPPDYRVVENADHFDFLAPCSDNLRRYAPQICVSRPGFDRAAFHETFNREIVDFFKKTLP